MLRSKFLWGQRSVSHFARPGPKRDQENRVGSEVPMASQNWDWPQLREQRGTSPGRASRGPGATPRFFFLFLVILPDKKRYHKNKNPLPLSLKNAHPIPHFPSSLFPIAPSPQGKNPPPLIFFLFFIYSPLPHGSIL